MMKVHFAAGVAGLALLAAAGAAHAGGASTTSVALTSQSPNPSTTTQSVTLAVAVTPASNAPTCGGSVAIRDTTGGGDVAVCTAPVSSAGAGLDATGQCTYTFPTPGTRSLALGYTSSNLGDCQNSVGTGSQVVTGLAVAAVPTMTEWALWGLAGLLMLGGTAFVVRRTGLNRL